MSTLDSVNNMYKKLGYSGKYGGSIWSTVILLLVFICLIAYYYVMNHLEPIKANWAVERCNPLYIPLAGIIIDPDDMSSFDYTQLNFQFCIQGILSSIVSTFLSPVYYLVSVIQNTLNLIVESVNKLRELMNSLRTSIAGVSKTVMEKILNFLVVFQHIIIKLKDIVNKAQGVMVSSIYTMLGTVYTLQAAMGAMVEMSIAILGSLAGIIIALLFIPFELGLIPAIPLIIMFLVILIPLILVIIVSTQVLHQHTSTPPELP